MSAQATNAMITLENFNISELDLENQAQRPQNRNSDNEDEEILNIGEFVFNHIIRKTNGSITQSIRRRIAIHSKLFIKSCTFIDITIYICFLIISLFLLVQNGTIIAIQMTWLVYTCLVLTFIEGIVCVWILKVVIEAGYHHKIYITYILFRLISITILMSTIAGISLSQLFQLLETSDSKTLIAYNYFVTTLCLICTCLIYIVLSTVLYGFHMSVVKEFYMIVRIILEAHNYLKKRASDTIIGSPVPYFCVGVPLFKNDNPEWKQKEDENFPSLNLSMKDAKFEVEIQLQHDDCRDTKVLDKILVFQCDSESSGSDSNRLKIKDCEKIKKKSQKIPRGRKLTMLDDDYFYDHSKSNLGHNSSIKVLSSKCIGLQRDTIIEEDDDRYGLDFLEEYRTQTKTNGEGVTAFTSEGEYVFSPVSKHTLKKKFSVKKVVRRQSFSSQQSIKKRKFTINDENPNELR